MQLKSIHFSGFKSFVDPTTFKLHEKIIGIVGPNGCGKSNVIDAVRWVMGESSAKTLRGDNMTDVIFNGSSTRQPVGKASVELMFDNSQGKAPGAYSQYAEISVKRALSREGQSEYFLNNVRCRRKDITEIFLGTGLGPRSYSIIEQGMVSRIVEARPEDLRVFVEEAAGISKYKEKRRETENRIRHTRENLERVEDIAGELDAQLRRLDRQSKQAQRYKELKTQQRQLKSQTLVLKWQRHNSKLANFDVQVSRKEKELESHVSVQRESERKIEHLRQDLSQSQEALNQTQGKFYSLGAEVNSLEQQIEHRMETRQRQVDELQRIDNEINQAKDRLTQDSSQREELSRGYQTLLPQVQRLRDDHEKLKSELGLKEQALQHWQQEWDEFQQHSNQSVQDREVLKANIEHLSERQIELQGRQQNTQEQQQVVDEELNSIEPEQLRKLALEEDELCQKLDEDISKLSIEINELREKIKALDDSLKIDSEKSLEIGGKLESLKELQKAALGQNDEQFNDWLEQQGLSDHPRLTTQLEVEPGWEKAVDTALKSKTASLCVNNLNQYANSTLQMEHIEINFIEDNGSQQTNLEISDPKKLLNKIRSKLDLGGLLDNVFTAESVDSALSQRSSLNTSQYFITRNGTQIGSNWITFSRTRNVEAGLIEREQLISSLAKQLAEIQSRIDEQEQLRSSVRNRLSELDTKRSQKTHTLTQVNSKRTQTHKQLAQQEEIIRELKSKQVQLEQQRVQIVADLESTVKSISDSTQSLQSTESNVVVNEQSREEYEEKRDKLRQEYQLTRKDLEQVRELLDNDNVRLEKLSTALESIKETSKRTQEQLDVLLERHEQVGASVETPENQDAGLTQSLQVLLESRSAIEQDLQAARNQVSEHDQAISMQDQRRQKSEYAAIEMRNKLESSRLEKQEIAVKQQAVKEQLDELETDIPSVIEQLPEEADFKQFQSDLEQLEQKITRLGTVNLLAIEEYEEQQKRKIYLDKQHEDLSKALNTLEEVMQKIDKETRQRFRETFNQLNAGFKEYFPKLFGGGSASLELTDDDLLSTGVAVMARPPGKRNSTIHLLSGGEKALTAVSLLFSLFQLNPSPLCILDEVDAPLDDANVERYCRTLVHLAEHTQLMFITHNKITMEYAKLLIGVTMQEPGVSRLVTVDVDKALELAEQG